MYVYACVCIYIYIERYIHTYSNTCKSHIYMQQHMQVAYIHATSYNILEHFEPQQTIHPCPDGAVDTPKLPEFSHDREVLEDDRRDALHDSGYKSSAVRKGRRPSTFPRCSYTTRTKPQYHAITYATTYPHFHNAITYSTTYPHFQNRPQ